jgi:hypothetical protein
MRIAARVLALATLVAVSGIATVSWASLHGLPHVLNFQRGRLSFEAPTLGPMAHMRFCIQFHPDCEVQGGRFQAPQYRPDGATLD